MNTRRIRYQVSTVKHGQDWKVHELSLSAHLHLKRFLKVKMNVAWEDPTKLFGFKSTIQVHEQLKELSLLSGYPKEVQFTPDSIRAGELCARAMRHFLYADSNTADDAVEASLHRSENVEKASVKRYLGTRLDHLKGAKQKKRKFEELSIGELHPDLDGVGLEGPFRKERIGHHFKASIFFMRTLSSLYTEISGEGPSEKPPSPLSCRSYCAKIGEELFKDPSKIDSSMVALLDHFLVESGSCADNKVKAQGLIVLCMTSCGELHAGNWREAKVSSCIKGRLTREIRDRG